MKTTINPKTVHKWKKRTHLHDAAMGPKRPHSTVLNQEEEVMIVAFRIPAKQIGGEGKEL